MDGIEQIIFEIISNGGNAKGLAYEAIQESEKGNFDKAEEWLKEADEFLRDAHQVQTTQRFSNMACEQRPLWPARIRRLLDLGQ